VRSLERAIVVGGAGFFGSWLVDVLLEAGIETTVIDSRGESSTGAATIVEDVHGLELNALIDDLGADALFQLAGTGLVPSSIERPLDDLVRNTSTTLTVLEAARRSARRPVVAYVSSAAVYGNGVRFPMTEEHPLQPLSPYGISKLAAENYVRFYASTHQVAALSIRPFSLYGPRQRKLVVYDLLERLLRGEDPLVIEGDASVTRDFVYIEDAARALLGLARRASAHGEAYNIASGSPCSLGALTSTLLKATGSTSQIVFTGNVRLGDPLRWDGDASRARALGATFDTPLETGLATTFEWLSAELIDAEVGL
jgi:UDP-glucose 4-epimerase